MSLGEHLVELRKRLFIAAIAITVLSIGSWFLVPFVLDALRAPLLQAGELAHRTSSLNYDGLTQAFDVKIQLAVTLGLVLSSPVWLYQVWAFIVPGLKRREKRYAIGFLGSAIPLFLLGCAAGWFIMPHMVQLLTSFAPAPDTSIVNAKDYVDFITKLVIAVGVGFVLPVFLVLLNFIGILDAKAILKGWRIAVIVITLFTALVTPSADVVSMFVLAIPMVGLYFAAAFVAWLHDRSVARRQAAFSSEIAV
ncbi:twin-arginine translocase subunit TatC [Galbitalea soli]|uniref:Sec-independent protein translocase protein TatC n=2 Tax=Galbitalea soli TaxID=1268042 RepID=A0A7C9PL70_9MICO|nr:twin-arginine translocase subunit TatC [Galbitalea soli]NEM90052.1 twin-arginine translocase subunit TatC [Galbitalea soli]